MAKKHILPVIVIAQFACTSLWFAGNGIMPELAANFNLADSALSHLTSAVQFGFIIGTLVFAFLSIADRFSPSKVFFFCAVLGALLNLGALFEGNNLTSLFLFRFGTGFFLAGIYPVGMKIAADYFQKGLGRSLGFLVGALVLGTAFPHLLKGIGTTLPWRTVLFTTSSLASFGGLLLVTLVPDGPFRKQSQKPDPTAFFKIFKNKKFRSAAFGYFGHMWELYAFWTFVPIMIATFIKLNPDSSINISLWSFFIIGLGSLACVIGGLLAEKHGSKRIAFTALLLSGICCLLSPFAFQSGSIFLFLSFLIFWGLVVIADSPLFSTLVAKNADSEIKGTALTIVNCIGFSITIISIQFINFLQHQIDPQYLYLCLAIGPILGLLALNKK